jgi:hypothetical protein
MQRAGNPGRTSVHGTKKMGVAPSNALLCGPRPYSLKPGIILTHGAKAFEKTRFRPMYAVANMGHPSTAVRKLVFYFHADRLYLRVLERTGNGDGVGGRTASQV